MSQFKLKPNWRDNMRKSIFRIIAVSIALSASSAWADELLSCSWKLVLLSQTSTEINTVETCHQESTLAARRLHNFNRSTGTGSCSVDSEDKYFDVGFCAPQKLPAGSFNLNEHLNKSTTPKVYRRAAGNKVSITSGCGYQEMMQAGHRAGPICEYKMYSQSFGSCAIYYCSH